MTATAAKPVEQKSKVYQLRLDRIRRDGGTQARVETDSEWTADLAEILRQKKAFRDRMVVFRGVDDRTPDDHTVYDWLADGFHRFLAYEQEGHKCAECDVFRGPRRAAVLYAVGANGQHGKQRTDEDKWRSVRLILEDEEWRQRSNIWISERCCVSDTFVGTVRKVMEEERRLKEESSLQTNRSEKEETPRRKENNRHRQSRNKHGGTQTTDTTNIGTKDDKNGYRERSVYLCDNTKDPQHFAKVMMRYKKSRKKPIRDAKELGLTWDEYVEDIRPIWDSIPVVES